MLYLKLIGNIVFLILVYLLYTTIKTFGSSTCLMFTKSVFISKSQ